MTYIYDQIQGRMVPLTRQAKEQIVGINTKAPDPTSADVAVPRAFKELEQTHSAAKIARDAGFSVSQIKKAWFAIALCLLSFSSFASDIQRGVSFSDGQRITAAQLHTLVDSATIQNAFYTGKTIQTNLNSTDYILIYNSGATAYRKVSGDNFLLNNISWISTRLETTNLTATAGTNDYFIFYDQLNGNIAKISLANLTGANTNTFGGLTLATNWVQAWQFPVWDGTNNWRLPWVNIQTNISTNWPAILYIGPTNSTYGTNPIVALYTNLIDADRIWIYDSVGQSNKATTILDVKKAVTNSSIIGNFRNLQIQNGATSNLLSLTADEVQLQGTNGAAFLCSNVSLTININNTGTNGLDTGSKATNTWYYSYVISDGTNVNGLLSTNSVAPVMPTNFQYKAMLGASWNDNTNNFINQYQAGLLVSIKETNLLNKACTTANTFEYLATTNATALATMIPPIARSVRGSFGSGTSLASGTVAFAVTPNTNGVGAVTSYNYTIVTAAGFYPSPWQMFNSVPFSILVQSNQMIAFRVDDNTTKCRINISGYGL